MGLFVMLGLSGGGGLALGVPSLPEDPVLAKVAPEECLFYTSWAGAAKPDPKSTNQTEQLLAEPEVQQMVAELERRIRSSLAEAAKREGPEAAVLVDEAIGWAKTLLTRPTAVFLTSVKPPIGPSQGPEIRGGMVVNVGEDGAKLKASLEKYQPALLRGPAKAEEVEIAGQKWHCLRLDPGAPPITWGIKGKYLMIGVGEGELQGMLKRAQGSAPKWLTALRKQLPVERPSTVAYVDVKALVDLAITEILREDPAPKASRGPTPRQVLDALGLGNVTSLGAVSGLDKEGYVSRTLLAIDGKPQGIFALATEKPLTAADLAPIPSDATIALAAQVNPDRVFETILSIVGQIEPRARQEILQEFAQAKEHLGVDFQNDVFKSLGDTWCIYNSPSESGLIPIGAIAVVQVKDYKRLATAHEKLLAAAKEAAKREGERAIKGTKDKSPPRDTKGRATTRIEKTDDGRTVEVEVVEAVEPPPRYPPPRRRPGPQIEHFQFAGKEVYFFNARTAEFPLAPAWCLTEKELIFSLFPQGIKAYLSRGAKAKSLAKVPEVAEALQGGGPLGLAYCDARKLFDLVYPFVPMIAQWAVSAMAWEGINVDVSLLPSAGAIGRHLRPSLTVVRRTKAGIEMVSHQSLPGGNIGASAPVLVALLVPAIQSTRDAARRAQSANNLHQVSTAMQAYASNKQTLPPAYKADKEGKPLLSWRVLILPYLDRQDLYQQFHLDEPWDSEHNKKLIENMPAIYRHPGMVVPHGMTHYQTVRGEKTAFPGKEGIGFDQFTDGTSNTVMVVEARKPVVWTRPDDYQYDEKNPGAGLLFWARGVCNVAFCDGSVQTISASTRAKIINALFTRNGGETVPIDWDYEEAESGAAASDRAAPEPADRQP
jgi:prepilin-type processing-associated H-X9-DG protein